MSKGLRNNEELVKLYKESRNEEYLAELIQFEIDALEAEGKEPKKQEPPTHPNCKCAVHPIFADLENGKGVSCGVLELEVPKGTPPEEIIQMAIKKIYGMEE